MSRLNSILLVIAVILGLGLVWSWDKLGNAASDWKASEFSNSGELRKSGLIDKGWVPQWLPASAHKIKETHSIDTNAGYLYFHFTEEDLAELKNTCPKIIQPVPKLPERLNSSWKPQNPDSYFSCNDGFLAINSTQFTALFWR